MCFEFWAKCHFQWTQKSVHLHCYGSFKWRLHVFRRQLSNSHHCLVYVLLEDVNQISRTGKCHFAFYAFYIFHEQRFQSFTSRLVKSRVVVKWCFLWFISICKYIQTYNNNKTNKQTKQNKKTPNTSLYYVDQWLLFRHCSDIPTYEEKCCEKTEV